METNLLDGSLNPVNIARVMKHNHDFLKSHPNGRTAYILW